MRIIHSFWFQLVYSLIAPAQIINNCQFLKLSYNYIPAGEVTKFHGLPIEELNSLRRNNRRPTYIPSVTCKKPALHPFDEVLIQKHLESWISDNMTYYFLRTFSSLMKHCPINPMMLEENGFLPDYLYSQR